MILLEFNVCIFVFILGLMVTIAFLAYYFSEKKIILRKLSKYENKKVTQFKANEPTKVTGKVLQVENPFIAPYSKRKCVAYVFEIKQEVQSGKSSRWKTIVKKTDIQDFFIEADSEMVMVKPSLASSNYKSYLVEDGSVSSGFLNNPQLNSKRF